MSPPCTISWTISQLHHGSSSLSTPTPTTRRRRHDADDDADSPGGGGGFNSPGTKPKSRPPISLSHGRTTHAVATAAELDDDLNAAAADDWSSIGVRFEFDLWSVELDLGAI